MKLVDAYLLENLVVYRGLETGGAVGRGWEITLPDMENADQAHVNSLEDDIRVILRQLGANSRMQLIWTVDSDYRRELLEYQKVTERCGHEWERLVRSERFERYWKRMLNRQLRRERLHFFVTSKVSTAGMPRGKGRRKAYEYLLDTSRRELDGYGELFEQIFGQMGGEARAMEDLDHFRLFHRFFNPSAADDAELDHASLFNPELSMGDQCFMGDAAPLERPHVGFYLGGYYHGIITLRTLPKTTYQGMIEQFTKLQMLDYSITCNITPRSVAGEILREEGDIVKLERAYRASQKVKLKATQEKKETKIRRLMSNQVVPYECQWIIRAWDTTPEGLRAKIAALTAAAHKMGGCQTYEAALPTSARNYYFASLPGWTWHGYRDNTHYVEDVNLANLLPLSATPVGMLDGAEALYDGANSNLIGVRTFEGNVGRERPAHGLILGSSGSGKSVFTIDLLTQTAPYYDYTVIVEEGLSYGTFTRLHGCEPVIVQPNGTLTFNYLDTGGLPLSPLHIANCTALLQLMTGLSADEDKNRMRAAVLGAQVQQLYDDTYQEWGAKHPDRLDEAARVALVLEEWIGTRMVAGSTWFDAFLDFREWRAANPNEASAMLAAWESGAVLRSLKNETGQVRNIAFALMTPAEMPQHSQLQSAMWLDAQGSGAANGEELGRLATLLKPWCRNGNYGAILDGETNVDLRGRVTHFELGFIPESAAELRAVAAFLITNQARNEIMTRPRSQRKRVILEELSAFLAVPNGDRITREFYERMRKYNCWVVSVIQQYDRIRNHPVRGSLMGNSRQVYMLKQQDRPDLDNICETFPIPDVTKGSIMRFPDPSAIRQGEPWSGICYYHLGDHRPVIATARNFAAREMLYASSSSGEAYESRTRELAGRKDVLAAVIEAASNS